MDSFKNPILVSNALVYPSRLVFDAEDNPYIFERGTGSDKRVYRIDIKTDQLELVAGGGSNSNGYGGLALDALFLLMEAIAIDPNGNLDIADRSNFVLGKVSGPGSYLTFTLDDPDQDDQDGVLNSRSFDTLRPGNYQIDQLLPGRLDIGWGDLYRRRR